MEKEMATHSSVLAWSIPGTAEPGGLLSMGSHRVGHDWSNLAAAAYTYTYLHLPIPHIPIHSSASMDLSNCGSCSPLCACVLSRFSHVWLFMTLCSVAHQDPLSKGFSRQEYCSGLPCPPPGDLPDPEIELLSLYLFCTSRRFFTTSTTWEAL